MGIRDQGMEGGCSRTDKPKMSNCIIMIMGRRRAGKTTFVRKESRHDELIRDFKGDQVLELISNHSGTTITYAELPAFNEPLERTGKGAMQNADALHAIFQFLVESLQRATPNQVAGVLFIHNMNGSAGDARSLDELNLNMMLEIAGVKYRNRLELILNQYGTSPRIGEMMRIREIWRRVMEGESDPIVFNDEHIPGSIVQKILRGGSPVNLTLVDEYLVCGHKLHKTEAGKRISLGYEIAIQQVVSQIQQLEEDKDQLRANFPQRQQRNEEKIRIKADLRLKKREKKELVTERKIWNEL